jgi:hypothetical protein
LTSHRLSISHEALVHKYPKHPGAKIGSWGVFVPVFDRRQYRLREDIFDCPGVPDIPEDKTIK